MKNLILVSLMLIVCPLFAQNKPKFVNMTEFGGLFGRVVYDINNWNGTYSQASSSRLSFSIKTFNGVQLKPRLAVGMVIGSDWYKTALIMPIAAGMRYDLVKNSSKKSNIFASMDAGYGFNWLHADINNTKTTGGLMINPGIGYKIGLNSQSALIFSLSYKRQNVNVKIPNNGWNDIEVTEKRAYNRLSVNLGFLF